MASNAIQISVSNTQRWVTLEHTSQSLSSAISPSGRYMFVVYLFGLNVLDTETGKEFFHMIHPDQANITEPEFNICGFVSISDNVGYSIERTDEQYGDYYLRRIEFNHAKKTHIIDQDPRVLAFDVKCLTVCYDFQVKTNELHVILRQEPPSDHEDEERHERHEVRVWCCFKLQNNEWVENRERIYLNELSKISSWDLFPKFYNNALYVFPVKPTSTTVYAKLKQFDKIARVDAVSEKLKMISVKSSLETWAKKDEHEDALFVDNMDYKWIENELFLLFIVVLQENHRSNFFENHLAVFSLERMEWREIILGDFCAGEQALNPYRMQITPDRKLYLIVPSAGHPCTTFGNRENTNKKRLLWRPFRSDEEIQKHVWHDFTHSYLYFVQLTRRAPIAFDSAARKTVYRVYPQLKNRPFHEFSNLLSLSEPPKKRVKRSECFEESNEELVGDGHILVNTTTESSPVTTISFSD